MSQGDLYGAWTPVNPLWAGGDDVIFVGELNPHGGDMAFALYPLPAHSAGGRLSAILDMPTTGAYVSLGRANLCVGSWSAHEARINATAIYDASESSNSLIVMLGRKVAKAFGVDERTDWLQVSSEPDNELSRLLLFPHPSGLNRVWNDQTMIQRARDKLARLRPKTFAHLVRT